MKNIPRRGYHLISNSPWPFLGAIWTIAIFYRFLEIFHFSSLVDPRRGFTYMGAFFGMGIVLYG